MMTIRNRMGILCNAFSFSHSHCYYEPLMCWDQIILVHQSVSWLLMPCLLESPGHQRLWYWLCRIGKLSYKRISTVCVVSVGWNDINCRYIFIFPVKNLASKGLRNNGNGWHMETRYDVVDLLWPYHKFLMASCLSFTRILQGCFAGIGVNLTHWGLVTPFGDIDLGQHWLR